MMSRQEEKERAFISFITAKAKEFVGSNFYGRMVIEMKAGNIVFIRTEQTTQMEDLINRGNIIDA